MKAIRFHTFGDAGVLRYEDAPAPVIGPNDVLLQVKAAALNHLDVWVRSGLRERNVTLPHIPGSDGAGVVIEIGSAVTSIKVGTNVVVSPGLSCGTCSFCMAGRDNFCNDYRVLGVRENGTNAEFLKLPSSNVFPIPEGMDFPQAAAIPVVFLTAWHMLSTLAKVQPGETVLVHGAGSGVGSAGIQVAKLLGARVLTTAGSDEKLAKAKQLGADELINYATSDFAEEVKRLTDKRGVDVVFEHIGGSVFEKSIPIIARGGRLVTCGVTTDYNTTIDMRYVYSRHMTIYGSWMGGRHELLEVLKFFRKDSPRQLKPVVDQIFPLAEAAQAHRRMEERKHFGKIVFSV